MAVTDLSVRKHISKTTRPNFTEFYVHVACGRSLVLRWRRCIRITHYEPYDTAAAASLQCSVRPNTPAALYWFILAIDYGRR